LDIQGEKSLAGRSNLPRILKRLKEKKKMRGCHSERLNAWQGQNKTKGKFVWGTAGGERARNFRNTSIPTSSVGESNGGEIEIEGASAF